MKKQNLKLIFTILCIIAAGLCYSCSEEKEAVILLETDYEIETSLQPSSAEQQYYYVDICGEVHNPGVFQMEPGSRIFEVVDLAGGFTDAAAVSHLNLAQAVTDGMKIVVFSKEQIENQQLDYGSLSGGDQFQVKKINLNTASKEQLMTLRGIGESRAEDIIRYREQHGPFKKVEDIMQVSGIKEAAFEKIKDDIEV